MWALHSGLLPRTLRPARISHTQYLLHRAAERSQSENSIPYLQYCPACALCIAIKLDRCEVTAQRLRCTRGLLASSASRFDRQAKQHPDPPHLEFPSWKRVHRYKVHVHVPLLYASFRRGPGYLKKSAYVYPFRRTESLGYAGLDSTTVAERHRTDLAECNSGDSNRLP